MIRVLTRDHQDVATHVAYARTWPSRLKGLLGRRSLRDQEGLWIEPCNSIHTFFMRFPIDAVFISKDKKILRLYSDLKPFRITSLVPHSQSVLELPAGKAKEKGLAEGDELIVESLQ